MSIGALTQDSLAAYLQTRLAQTIAALSCPTVSKDSPLAPCTTRRQAEAAKNELLTMAGHFGMPGLASSMDIQWRVAAGSAWKEPENLLRHYLFQHMDIAIATHTAGNRLQTPIAVAFSRGFSSGAKSELCLLAKALGEPALSLEIHQHWLMHTGDHPT